MQMVVDQKKDNNNNNNNNIICASLKTPKIMSDNKQWEFDNFSIFMSGITSCL